MESSQAPQISDVHNITPSFPFPPAYPSKLFLPQSAPPLSELSPNLFLQVVGGVNGLANMFDSPLTYTSNPRVSPLGFPFEIHLLNSALYLHGHCSGIRHPDLSPPPTWSPCFHPSPPVSSSPIRSWRDPSEIPQITSLSHSTPNIFPLYSEKSQRLH